MRFARLLPAARRFRVRTVAGDNGVFTVAQFEAAIKSGEKSKYAKALAMAH